MKQVLVMAKIGRPIKFVIRLTPEERTRLEWMIHCGIGAVNSALKARILHRAPRLLAQGIVDSPLCKIYSVKKYNFLVL